MTRWEYAQVEVRPKTMTVTIVFYGTRGYGAWNKERNDKLVEAKNSDQSLLAVLDVLGDEGWELVSGPVIPLDEWDLGFFLMKRPKKTDQATELEDKS